MFNKFKEGLVFGAGFSVAFIIITYAANFAISPTLLNYNLKQLKVPPSFHMTHAAPDSSVNSSQPSTEYQRPFHELLPDEQIQSATAIVRATYEKQPDGRMAATIKEFLKKKEGVTIHYEVGDEYADASYYPSERKGYGDGVIIFFVGSPAAMQSAMTYSGNRILGLGNMPMDLFRSKCRESDS